MIKELTSAIAVDSYSRTIDYTNNQLTICILFIMSPYVFFIIRLL